MEKERDKDGVTFLPGGTRFWLVLRMCVRAFLMFFSFMLDSTAGGRNNARPHSFLQTQNGESVCARLTSRRGGAVNNWWLTTGLLNKTPHIFYSTACQQSATAEIASLQSGAVAFPASSLQEQVIRKTKQNGLFESWYTHSIYLRDTFWDCLVLMVRIYICRAARRRAVSYFSSDPNLSNTTSLQLWRSQRERERTEGS